MTGHQPPLLAEQVAAILARIHASVEDHHARPGLVAALHALILSAFARLFTRLETLVALWQAGQLPATAARPQAPMPAPRTQAASRPTPRHTKPRQHTPKDRINPPTPAARLPRAKNSHGRHPHPAAPSRPEAAVLPAKIQKNSPV